VKGDGSGSVSALLLLCSGEFVLDESLFEGWFQMELPGFKDNGPFPMSRYEELCG